MKFYTVYMSVLVHLPWLVFIVTAVVVIVHRHVLGVGLLHCQGNVAVEHLRNSHMSFGVLDLRLGFVLAV